MTTTTDNTPTKHTCTHDSVQTDHGLNVVYCCYCGAYYGNAWEFDEDAPLAPQRVPDMTDDEVREYVTSTEKDVRAQQLMDWSHVRLPGWSGY
tara:strand:+ start:337 stop:615 length:279 start_codon:yes stop_codon:yes gene_type:complete